MLKLSFNVNECKPLPSSPTPMESCVITNSVGAWEQGLTLVHFSAQCKHVLLDTLGACLLDRGTHEGVTKTA